METPEPNEDQPMDAPETDRDQSTGTPESDGDEPPGTPETKPEQTVAIPPEFINIRPVEERDIAHIINLLRLNYGDNYPDRELYDVEWVKRAILNENIHWLVAEDGRNGEVLASGAIKLDYGDYDDQLGIIGRLVKHPRRSSDGLLPLGSKIVKQLVSKAEAKIECVISDARTELAASQLMVEHARLKAVGFLPHYKCFNKRPESLVVYTNLYGEGRAARSEGLPQVLESIEPLATHALSEMKLPKALVVVKSCPPYPAEVTCSFTDGDQRSLGLLRQLYRNRPGDPIVFANVTSNYGIAVLADQKVYHRMAIVDQQLVGAFGYKFDENNQIFQITELVFNKDAIINPLCAEAVSIATEKEARIIEVDLSAYDSRIQQTFLDYGFHAVAYIPAMVCHNNSRLDVIKMMKLNAPYSSSEMELTKKAERIVSLVEATLG